MTKPKTYAEKAAAQALRTFGHDLASIREGYAGGHFPADVAAREFRAACVEVARRIERLEAAA